MNLHTYRTDTEQLVSSVPMSCHLFDWLEFVAFVGALPVVVVSLEHSYYDYSSLERLLHHEPRYASFPFLVSFQDLHGMQRYL